MDGSGTNIHNGSRKRNNNGIDGPETGRKIQTDLKNKE